MLAKTVAPSATIRKRAASLTALPDASKIVFSGLYGWSPVSTTALTETLGVDRGNWATWRNRRLTPTPLPAAWFKPKTGQPLIYRVDHVLAWLAHRAGKPRDPLAPWRDCLRTDFGLEGASDDEICRQVVMYASVIGPRIGDVTYTAAGFAAYLASLSK